MHHYHKLQQTLDTHPMGAPPSEEFLEILKILFPPGEVELAALMDFKLRTAGEIARRAGMPEKEALQKLEAMADRGSVLAKKLDGQPAYALLPNYPGLFEYPIIKGVDGETLKRLAKLWHAYYMRAMAAELASASPPWTRVFPAEEALTEEYEILPFEVASKMMERTKAIALANCACRISAGNCDKPLDVCLAFDGAASFLAEREMARLISLQEAVEVLKRAEEAGLVHTGNNAADKLLFLCNCCPCCCHFLRLITEHNYTNAVAKSSYQARLDGSLCTGCGICAEERCPVKALNIEGDHAVFHPEKCIGCGLCVSTCPTGALRLEKRANHQPPPATTGELVARITATKKL
ncbi:4Fe-4S dicluster domain-containing protein [Desulfallas sp. Bu1-1]|uniref:4Fe-4S binding protein n=1 Tax=Desulfallas sp. Bu1-1 TaxID=2787620 RepID=UPI00189F8F41|nr:4Fe-4S dicluster domain-containing protein [Desulfallas sp. Bu1-1]MBF7084301.1 4Fe-4S dicluster domain-containing protein [Desulfallas sp. Bu1-1]